MATSFHFGNLVFEHVSRIEPERDSSGAVRDFTPHVRFQRRKALKLLNGGEGPFCKFSISRQWLGKPGVYVFLVDSAATYVGECECLVKRMNQGYGNIAPRNCFVGGQQTNVRINRLIRDAALEGRNVELVFCGSNSRTRIESEMIKTLTPPWNRTIASRSMLSVPEVKVISERYLASLKAMRRDRTSGCREEILKAARDVVREKGRNEFTVLEIISRLQSLGADCSESTIRTHITSRCCRNAPKNHAVTYEDFERITRGLYRLV